MKLKTVTLGITTLILGIFAAFSVSLNTFTNLLEYESREISKAGDSIRVANRLKIKLLVHNRNTFLHQVTGDPSQHESKVIKQKQISELLKLAEQSSSSAEEDALLVEVRETINLYLKQLNQIKESPLSSSVKYALATREADKALLTIDRFIELNQNQKDKLMLQVNKLNSNASQTAILIFVLGMIVLFIIVIAVLIWITRPMNEIARSIEKYIQGQSTIRITAKGLKELQLIATNFNSMVQSLEEQKKDQLRFIACIAHDLRTPLTSMSIASQLLAQKASEANHKLSRVIYQQVRNFDRLVGDLLDITNIEAGRLDLNISETDIKTLITDAVELHRVGTNLHHFKIEITEEPLICNCDSSRLLQVINNILSNAIKYSPNGGTIELKAWNDHNLIKIMIKDQGIGIDVEDLENIFKPFQRTKMTKETIPGIGLGLSVSRRIVEAHEGTLTVKSVLKQGSEFMVTLPSLMRPQASLRRKQSMNLVVPLSNG